MDKDIEFSIKDLEKCSYRSLQQFAKSMQLPSNVKKIYLIQLIHAKKHCSEADVEAIVQRVRLERHLAGKVNKRKGKKKMRLQNTEVSSTNRCLSPPISSTPKRPGFVICDPFAHATFPKPQVARVYSTQSKSDRVLRSFNLNAYKRPNYSFLNDSFDNAVIGVIKAPKKETDLEDGTSQERKYPKLSLATKCIVRKLRPSFTGGVSCLKRDVQMVPAASREICLNLSKDKPQTSPEALSKNNNNFECVQSFGFRRNDGKMSKINALVQKSTQTKPPESYFTAENSCSNVVTIQDIINSNIAQTFTDTNVSDYGLSESTMTAPYPNTSTPNVTECSQNDIEHPVSQSASAEKENDPEESFAVYFHKKIRADQVKQRIQREPMSEREARLPKIGEAFTCSSFQNYSRDVTEPLYVQVSEDSRTGDSAPNIAVAGTVGVLEPLYNFKSSMLVHAPLIPVTTTHTTTCTYSTPVRVTAVAQPSVVEEEMPPETLYEQDRQGQYQYTCTNDEITRMCEYLRLAEQEITLRKYHEALAMATSSSSLESQDMGPSATEMVEDAMELISQDGDYMERISMDVRMQCILCSWAGPKIVLDLHVEKRLMNVNEVIEVCKDRSEWKDVVSAYHSGKEDHASDIVKQDCGEWNTTYRLGSLSDQPLWLSEVRELDSRRYALSVKRESDWLLVSLSTLTIDPDPKVGSVTIFNKVTGQPYTWEGPIQLLPTNMPYENDGNFLRVAVEELDLVPRNPELKSTNKVVGRLDLNDVYFIIFVKIM